MRAGTAARWSEPETGDEIERLTEIGAVAETLDLGCQGRIDEAVRAVRGVDRRADEGGHHRAHAHVPCRAGVEQAELARRVEPSEHAVPALEARANERKAGIARRHDAHLAAEAAKVDPCLGDHDCLVVTGASVLVVDVVDVVVEGVVCFVVDCFVVDCFASAGSWPDASWAVMPPKRATNRATAPATTRPRMRFFRRWRRSIDSFMQRRLPRAAKPHLRRAWELAEHAAEPVDR